MVIITNCQILLKRNFKRRDGSRYNFISHCQFEIKSLELTSHAFDLMILSLRVDFTNEVK